MSVWTCSLVVAKKSGFRLALLEVSGCKSKYWGFVCVSGTALNAPVDFAQIVTSALALRNSASPWPVILAEKCQTTAPRHAAQTTGIGLCWRTARSSLNCSRVSRLHGLPRRTLAEAISIAGNDRL